MRARSIVLSLAVIATAALAPVAGAADKLKIEKALIVGRAEAGAAWKDGPTDARKDDDPELAVVLVARLGKKTVYVVDDDVAPLLIGGKKIDAKARRTFDAALPGKVEVRWSLVEPHAWREEGVTAPNGSKTSYYSNVVTGGDKHGEWLGYDQVTYFETALGGFSSKASARRRAAEATPSEDEADHYDGLGTMRYKVEVKHDGDAWATPGATAVDKYGIQRSVHRVSIRKDDTYNGWLSAYFLVPEVFGSAGPGKDHQTERYVGADCADVLVGALRAEGDRVDYSHVAGLTSYADVVAGPAVLDEDGVPDQEIDGVQPGDVIRIDYGGEWANATPRSWDHVAVLWQDKSDPDGPSKGAADGKLDGFDVVVHMGHPRLMIEEMSEQSPARVDVLRWNAKKLKRKSASR